MEPNSSSWLKDESGRLPIGAFLKGIVIYILVLFLSLLVNGLFGPAFIYNPLTYVFLQVLAFLSGSFTARLLHFFVEQFVAGEQIVGTPIEVVIGLTAFALQATAYGMGAVLISSYRERRKGNAGLERH
ncbi:MAG: hypothetical protein Q8L35_08245 [Actinomycetota bacterium]|nr:hypothetical protein [Actinomycetota bacterium]